MIQRVLFGPSESKHAEVGDASLIEAVPIVILLASIVVVGVYPALVTDVFKAGLEPIVERFG
jgi:NADH-quinone oxidoreductase subunit M